MVVSPVRRLAVPLMLAPLAALACAAPAHAAPIPQRVRFTVDVSAVMKVSFQQRSTTDSECGTGRAVSAASGSQVVHYAAQRVPATFVIDGPGYTHVVAYGSRHRQHGGHANTIPGRYRMRVEGSRTADDPACGTHDAQPRTGCGTHAGKAGFGAVWGFAGGRNRLYVSGAASTGGRFACPAADSPQSEVLSFGDGSGGKDRVPGQGPSELAFNKAVFTGHRRTLSYHAERSWTESGAHYDLSWRITWRRAGR
jgi:hypothetical protein